MANSLNERSGRAQAFLAAAVSAAIGVLTWHLLLSPARVDVAAKRARVATLQAELARARTTAARLPAVRREVAEMEDVLRQEMAVLPDEKDSQEVLRTLSALASESALDLRSFTPKAAVNRTEYAEWPIELGLAGGYHDLGIFLDRVANLSRLISVTDLHIQASAPPASTATISASCTATTFVFNKKAEAATPPPTLAAPATGGKGGR